MHRHAFLQCMWNSLHSNMPFVQVYWWHDKYRPRKPKYFNRVHTGYEWNKYNQTHYDHDNPPPKVVKGYKFNIFYPNLLDKTKTSIYDNCMFTPRYKSQHPIIMIACIQTHIHLTRHTHMHFSNKKTHSTFIKRRKTITCARIHNTYTHIDIVKTTNTYIFITHSKNVFTSKYPNHTNKNMDDSMVEDNIGSSID